MIRSRPRKADTRTGEEGGNLTESGKLRLLRKGAGLERTGAAGKTVGDSLDHLIGTWSQEDSDEFLQSIEPVEQIDPSFWK